jgi:thiamine biosynthesis lipoprotein
MLDVMKNRGFAKCLIDAGGDLTIGDAPKTSKGWRVEIGGRSHPELPILELSNCAVATSGDLEQNLEIGGTRYSHLLNPKTGIGLEGSAQVTVVAPTGMIADSIASTCLVLGIHKATLFLAQTSVSNMYYLTESNSSIKVHRYLPPH